MFTGIVTDLGTVRRIAPDGDAAQIETAYPVAEIAMAPRSAAAAAASPWSRRAELLAFEAAARPCRSPPRPMEGRTRVNLERALKVGDELGGHW